MTDTFSISNQRQDKYVYYCVNWLMVFIFAFTLVDNIALEYNMPFIVKLRIWITSLLTIIVFLCFITDSQKKYNLNKPLVAIYFIYSAYCYYYIFVDPHLPRTQMLQVPTDDEFLYQKFLYLTLQFLSAPLILKYINWKFFAKSILISNAILMSVYLYTFDMTPYILVGENENSLMTLQDLVDLNLCSPFWLALIAGMGCLFSIALMTLEKNKSKLFMAGLIYTFCISAYMMIIASKRGPLLWCAVTMMIFLYTRALISKRNFILILIAALLLYIFSEDLISMFASGDFAQGMLSRIESTAEDNGSGRYGSEYSVYGYSISQISTGPLFGSYFRILAMGDYWGLYPHNFFLETLMTFGFVFSLPFYWIIFKIAKNLYRYLKGDSNTMILSLCFFFNFLFYMTSVSIFLTYNFWILLAIGASIPSKESIRNKNN